MATTTELPRVRTDEKFKNKVFKTCETQGIKYAELVRTLLLHYTEGNIKIDFEDYGFEKSAKIALESDEVKRSIKKLDKFLRENPNRKYHNVKKA